MYKIGLCILITMMTSFACHGNHHDCLTTKPTSEDSDLIKRKVELEKELNLIKSEPINLIVITYSIHQSGNFEMKKIKLSQTDSEQVLNTLREHLYVPSKIVSLGKIALVNKATLINIGFDLFVNDKKITHYNLFRRSLKTWFLDMPDAEYNKLLDFAITILKENGIDDSKLPPRK